MRIQPNTRNDRIFFIPESQIDYFYCGIIHSKIACAVDFTSNTVNPELKISRVTVVKDILIRELTGFMPKRGK